MPCPEKFKESLEKFQVDEEVIKLINKGYENVVSKSPKEMKANYFQRAVDIMENKLQEEKIKEILQWNACCKSGARLKASKDFFKANKELTLEEKLNKISEVPNMGFPALNNDGTITVHAVNYKIGDKYHCACSNFSKSKADFKVSKTYCHCCGGHFLFHYEKMLGLKLKVKEVISSPLDSEGKNPCVFKLEII